MPANELPRWDDICTKFRQAFGNQLDDEGIGRFLIQLFAVYAAAAEPPPLAAEQDIDAAPYCRNLGKLLGREIDGLIAISADDPSACHEQWRRAIHADALAEGKALMSAVKERFDNDVYVSREVQIINAEYEPGGKGHDWIMDITRKSRSFFGETLTALFKAFPPILSQAAEILLQAHLWASLTKHPDFLADLEPLFLYLLRAPPIGKPAWSPASYLILTR
jgi:hypothetical protein